MLRQHNFTQTQKSTHISNKPNHLRAHTLRIIFGKTVVHIVRLAQQDRRTLCDGL